MGEGNAGAADFSGKGGLAEVHLGVIISGPGAVLGLHLKLHIGVGAVAQSVGDVGGHQLRITAVVLLKGTDQLQIADL